MAPLLVLAAQMLRSQADEYFSKHEHRCFIANEETPRCHATVLSQSVCVWLTISSEALSFVIHFTPRVGYIIEGKQ